jgi:hypothetical protein
VDAGMDTPLQQLGGELGEPALDLIEGVRDARCARTLTGT